MNASAYLRANRFMDRLTLAQAAVAWQGLADAQQQLVIVNDGMPFLAGVPDLADRAAALLDAAQRGKIGGVVLNEDGYPLRAEHIRLDRASVQAFIDSVDALAEPAAATASNDDALLRLSEVIARLGVSRATLYRRIDAGTIEAAHEGDPPRWRKSYIDSLVAGGSTVENDI